MKLLALDLSLTHTGWVVLELGALRGTTPHGTILTPGARRTHESEWEYRLRRYGVFRDKLLAIVRTYAPELILVESSRAAFAFKGQTDRARYSTSVQYRAGHGLGHAEGWLEAALTGLPSVPEIVTSDVTVAKRAITGNKTASKDQVRSFLEGVYGWMLDVWTDHEIDALAIGIAHLQIVEQTMRDRARSGQETTSSRAGSGSARPRRATAPSTGPTPGSTTSARRGRSTSASTPRTTRSSR